MTMAHSVRLLGFITAAALFGPASAGAKPPAIIARIGQTVRVDGPTVTPLAVIEDSRCRPDVRCVWAGQLRIRARIRTGAGTRQAEMTLGKPLAVADGQLTLVSATTDRLRAGKALAQRRYRLGFRFAGGF